MLVSQTARFGDALKLTDFLSLVLAVGGQDHPVAQGLLNIMVSWPCVKPVTHFGGFVWRRTAMVECVTNIST